MQLHGGQPPAASKVCLYGEADFDGDGKEDRVGLAVHSGSGAARLLVALAGRTSVDVLAELAPVEGGGIYTSLSVKPPGAAGILARDSPSLRIERTGAKAERMKALAAVNLCRPIQVDAIGRPDPLDTDNVCFCTEQFFFAAEAGFRSSMVCD